MNFDQYSELHEAFMELIRQNQAVYQSALSRPITNLQETRKRYHHVLSLLEREVQMGIQLSTYHRELDPALLSSEDREQHREFANNLIAVHQTTVRVIAELKACLP